MEESCTHHEPERQREDNVIEEESLSLQEQQSRTVRQRVSSRCYELCSHLTLSEISGSLGDLGTFIPLATALARQNAIYWTPTLFWAGFANVVTGFMWDVPMCVQPMKSIAAVAIAEHLTRHQVTGAGIWMGMFMVLLSVTNGIEMLQKYLVPLPLVSGIQMGVGINLSIRGLVMIQQLPMWWIDDDSNNNTGNGDLDCIALAVVVALVCLYLLREQIPQQMINSNSNSNNNATERQQSSPLPAPVGLYLFGMGLVLAIIRLSTPNLENVVEQRQDNESAFNVGGGDNSTRTSNDHQELYHWFGFEPVATWALHNMTWTDWKEGLLQGAIPQLPLTTLNSVVSVCCLATTLYPEKRPRQTCRRSQYTNIAGAVISQKEVGLSVGIMNLLLCPLGAMPCCHGAGGLAGQHKFGARYGTAVVFLGLNKMILAIFLGGSILIVLDALPVSILGLMLIVCGHELAMMGLTVLVQASSIPRNTTSTTGESHDNTVTDNNNGRVLSQLVLRKNAFIALVVVIVDVHFHKTHLAALSGIAAFMIYGDGLRNWSTLWSGRHSNAGGLEYTPVVQSEILDASCN